MAFIELGWIPLAACFLARLPFVWRGLGDAGRQPSVLAAVMLAAWGAASLLWSAEVGQGVQEIGNIRWAWIALGLWAVIDQRERLVMVMAAGFAVATCMQIGEWIGHTFGVENLVWKHPPRPEGTPPRMSGWWYQPAIGGTMLVAALGLHLPAAFMGRGAVRVIGLLGAAFTVVGLALTGTRGAWLSSIALVGLGTAVAVLQIRPWRRAWMVLGLATLAGGIALGTGWLVAGDAVKQRVDSARQEISAALTRGEFDSDTGARLAMMGWAWSALREHPLTGVGAGGFRAHAIDAVRAQGGDPQARRILPQAHNTVLHAGATLGVPGVMLVLAGAGLAIASAWRCGRERLGTYAAGPVFALLGLTLSFAFETIPVNAQTACLWLTLAALSPWSRVPTRGV
jgi:O-antigen ligase